MERSVWYAVSGNSLIINPACLHHFFLVENKWVRKVLFSFFNLFFLAEGYNNASFSARCDGKSATRLGPCKKEYDEGKCSSILNIKRARSLKNFLMP